MNDGAAARLCLLVDDYDQAIDFYCSRTDLFETIANLPLGGGMRNVVLRYVGLPIPFCLVVFRATTAAMQDLVGRQSAGVPLFCLPVEDCLGLYDRLRREGIPFEGEPFQLPYGCQATMIDPFGNRVCLFKDY